MPRQTSLMLTAVLCIAATAMATPIATVTLESPQDGTTVQAGSAIDWTIKVAVSTGDNAGLALISCDLAQNAENPIQFSLQPADEVPAGMEGFARPSGIANPINTAGDYGYRGSQRSLLGGAFFDLVQIGGGQNTFGIAGPAGVAQDVIVDTAIGQGGSPQIVASGSFTAPNAAGTYTFELANVIANVLQSVSPAPVPPAPWPVERADIETPTATFTVEVEATLTGDMNCDGVVDDADTSHFVQALIDPNGYDADHDGSPYPACARSRADLNVDTEENGLDIQLFVEMLLGN